VSHARRFHAEEQTGAVDELIGSALEAAQSTIDAKRHTSRRAALDLRKDSDSIVSLLRADCRRSQRRRQHAALLAVKWARCAFDEGETLNVAQQIRPEIAVTDISVRDMSGYDVAGRIRDERAGHATCTRRADRLGAGER
jgi:PleD family two-component response regulator